MDEFWHDLVYYGFWGAAIGIAVVPPLFLVLLGLAYLFPKRCPDCGTSLPKMRIPSSTRQALWGGWMCPDCGCEVDRRGRKARPER
jgi:hypothetical protein